MLARLRSAEGEECTPEPGRVVRLYREGGASGGAAAITQKRDWTLLSNPADCLLAETCDVPLKRTPTSLVALGEPIVFLPRHTCEVL